MSGLRRRNEPLRRAGFTLLELLLALGLTVTLLTAVYAALELHWRSSTLGQVEAERAQIARALLTRMSSDIRSVVYRAPTAGASSSSSSDSTDSATTDSSGSDSSTTEATTSTDTSSADDTSATVLPGFEDPADAYAADTTGLYGDSRTLVLHVLRPERPGRTLPDGSVTTSTGADRRTVAWFVADGQGVLQQLATVLLPVSSTRANQSLSSLSNQGLVRLSGDRLTLNQAEQQAELAAAMSQAEALAQEIESVSFEYHDGAEWVTDWDSEVAGGLPYAIGLTITFRPPEYPAGSIFARQPSASTDTYRMVVPLLTTEPFKVEL